MNDGEQKMRSRKKSQAEMLKEHLTSGKEITPIEALEKYGIFRLAARVHDLRDQGLKIETRTEQVGGKKWAVYRMASA